MPDRIGGGPTRDVARTLGIIVQWLEDIHEHVQALDSPTPTLRDVAQTIVILGHHVRTLEQQNKRILIEIGKLQAEPGGMNAAETAEVTQAFTDVTARLRGVATDAENPDPLPEPHNS